MTDRASVPWLEVAAVTVLAIIAGASWLALLAVRSLAAPVLLAALVPTALVTLRALRWRPSALIDVAASALAFVVVAGALLYRSTTFVGLPTVSTVHAIGDGLVNGLARTLASSVPAPPLPAIRLVPFTITWLAAFWGAMLTIRSRSTLTPCLAAAAGFALGLFVSGANDLVGLAGALAAVTVLFVVARVARVSGLGRRARSRRLLRFGLPVIAVVTLVSVGGASALTFASAPYDLHDRVPARIDPRAALTPLREIQARMSQPKPVPMFDVKLDPSITAIPNFRLSVLDQYDGSQWSSSERFVEASSRLAPAPTTAAPTQIIATDVTVRGLDGYWLPELATPVETSLTLVDVGGVSQALATPGRTVAGMHYTVRSAVVRPTAGQLQTALPDSSNPSGSELPPGPTVDIGTIKTVAAKVTAGATSPFAKLTALQTFLRSAPFRVSRDAPAGQSYARIGRLLGADHTGTSEQFATAYAVMARSLGCSTRVVAGFSHGPPKDGTITVTSADAYAWPEVALAGLGWVPFDSTPGSGDPAQNAPSSPAAATPPADDSGATDPNAAAQGAATDAATVTTATTNPLVVVGQIIVGLVLAALVLVPVTVVALRARRTRARRRAPAPRDRVVGAWSHAIGVVPPPPDRPLTTYTAAEVAALAGSRFGPDLGTRLDELGSLANRALFDPDHVDDADATEAWVVADGFREATRRSLRFRSRVFIAIDPRTLRGA
ncbi:MAG TPA: transglutaminaseTgpA domain-containing protein [Acidimicrobiales bacterium]